MACAQDYASPEPVEIGKELSRTTFVVYPKNIPLTTIGVKSM